jgi:hypothetical protein
MFKKSGERHPRGIYGSNSPNFAVPAASRISSLTEGCYIYDAVATNRRSPLRIRHPTSWLRLRAGEQNVAERMAKGEIFNTARGICELAELLVKRIDSMDWTLFARNSDVTTFS